MVMPRRTLAAEARSFVGPPHWHAEDFRDAVVRGSFGVGGDATRVSRVGELACEAAARPAAVPRSSARPTSAGRPRADARGRARQAGPGRPDCSAGGASGNVLGIGHVDPRLTQRRRAPHRARPTQSWDAARGQQGRPWTTSRLNDSGRVPLAPARHRRKRGSRVVARMSR